jgi:3-hydroxymyristoyl/3-hydroxydecanoyl-(acyl carrier protein) dehydratase
MTTLLVPMQHPAFSGHFPDAPLLPGVVLLDEMLRAVEEAGRGGGWSIATAKFLQPVRPGETLIFEHEPLTSGALRFAIRSGGRAVATGTLVPRLATTEAYDGHQAG